MQKAWYHCPAYAYEKYVAGIEKDWSKTERAASTALGTRAHQLLEGHFKGLAGVEWEPPACENEAVSAEADTLFAAYKAYYPVEPFEVVSVEQTFEVQLPDSDHSYTGKYDVVGRETDGPRRLIIIDHKTERRGGRDNEPAAWAARTQGALYLWAAQQIYNEAPAYLLLDILTRQSPAGKVGPTFRRDEITHDDAAKLQAVENIKWVADQITATHEKFGEAMWPQNRNACYDGWKTCEYADLHVYGRTTELIQLKYKQTEKYLDL